jgi:hypothetical protein
VSQPAEIQVNVPFRGRQLAEFLAIKEYLGIHSNADVVRYLVHRYARALRKREQVAERGSGGGGATEEPGTKRTPPPPADGSALADGGAVAAPESGPGYLCLHCPLPECDEGDPRCPYQQATGERDRQRARNRAAMRRKRARAQDAAASGPSRRQDARGQQAP